MKFSILSPSSPFRLEPHPHRALNKGSKKFSPAKSKQERLPEILREAISVAIAHMIAAQLVMQSSSPSTPLCGVGHLTPSTEVLLSETRLQARRMVVQGKAETSFTLYTDDAFLNGSTIDIKVEEFDTAPLMLNVTIAATNPEVASWIASHLPFLKEKLEQEEYLFKIHRLDTELGAGSKRMSSKRVHMRAGYDNSTA